MAQRTSNVTASLDDKIEILNGNTEQTPAAGQVFRTVGNVLALVRVRSIRFSLVNPKSHR